MKTQEERDEEYEIFDKSQRRGCFGQIMLVLNQFSPVIAMILAILFFLWTQNN